MYKINLRKSLLLSQKWEINLMHDYDAHESLHQVLNLWLFGHGFRPFGEIFMAL